jgi:hypothetical protein
MRRLLDGDADDSLLVPRVPVRLSSSKRGSRQPWRGMDALSRLHAATRCYFFSTTTFM